MSLLKVTQELRGLARPWVCLTPRPGPAHTAALDLPSRRHEGQRRRAPRRATVCMCVQAPEWEQASGHTERQIGDMRHQRVRRGWLGRGHGWREGYWGGQWGVERAKGRTGTRTRENLPWGQGPVRAFLVHQGPWSSPRLLTHDRTWQGWASGSGKPGLKSTGRPNSTGRLPPWIEAPKFTPRSSRKSDNQPLGWGVASVF